MMRTVLKSFNKIWHWRPNWVVPIPKIIKSGIIDAHCWKVPVPVPPAVVIGVPMYPPNWSMWQLFWTKTVRTIMPGPTDSG